METIKKRYASLLKALTTLETSLQRLNNKQYFDYAEIRDSIIQRFEYTTDTFWKVLKDFLQTIYGINIEIARPKNVFKISLDSKLISLQEYDVCINLIESRNLTSHGYHEDIAEEIIEKIPDYYDVMFAITQRLTIYLNE